MFRGGRPTSFRDYWEAVVRGTYRQKASDLHQSHGCHLAGVRIPEPGVWTAG